MITIVVDSEEESTESDDEFQICDICNSEEVYIHSFSSLFTFIHSLLYLNNVSSYAT